MKRITLVLSIRSLDIGGAERQFIELAKNIDKNLFDITVCTMYGGVQEEIVKSLPKSQKPELFYWHREAKSSNAEVDYVIQKGSSVAPIEVKAGTKGAMKSLKMFLKDRALPFGYRFSHENFCEYGCIKVMPIYAVSNLYKECPAP